MDAYRLSIEEVAARLGTSLTEGLTEAEARARLARWGPNDLAREEPVPGWRRFLAQFQDVLVLLLVAATAISAGIWFVQRDTALPYEALAILAVVLLNATMGYVQESRAEAALTALREMSAAQATVLRDGQPRRIHASEVVPGDVLLVEEGDAVPADARVFESVALQTAEAALTGESLPVTKEPDTIEEEAPLGDRDNMIFRGTEVTYGRGRGIVTETGMRTAMGRIAGLLAQTKDEATPLQQELARTGKRLGLIVVAIAVVMIATILLVEHVQTPSAVFQVFILGVALAVAAVPEGLPAVVTAVLSIGVQRMARRNAIVRNLAAVETLGSAGVIASDKTGTLTRNEMTVRTVVTASGRVVFEGLGYAPEGAVRAEGGGPVDGALRQELDRALAAANRANNARLEERGGRWTVLGDPTEGALLVAANKAGLDVQRLEARLPRVGEVPFSSERKLMSTIHRDTHAPGEEPFVTFTKGAPDVLLARCTHEFVGERVVPLSDERRAEILRVNEGLASEALRTLAVAARRIPSADHVERELVFAGLIGMIDPPRDEAKTAVARAKSAGIRPILITGDHPKTAQVIARELGIATDGQVMTGAELDRLPPDALAEAARRVAVYARVNPSHKLGIVEALQKNGAIVAMTGDGVNDAPALRKADIGVAMGITGTEVAKRAADIVLTDDNFASIVAAVEQGRAIFSNIRKFLVYLLASNIGEVFAMFFGVVFAGVIGLSAAEDGLVLPLLATQLLWINLVSDGAPALALGLDPADEGLMRRPPRPPEERVITGRMWRGIFFAGAIVGFGTLLVLDAALPGGLFEGSGDLRYGQTMAFNTLMLSQMFNVINARSETTSAFVGLFHNRWLWGAIALSVSLQIAVIHLPPLQAAFGTVDLSVRDWLRCTVAASAVLWLVELRKLWLRRRRAEPAGAPIRERSVSG